MANPFSGARQGFFGRADRKTHLEQLRHVSQWSRPVQLVTGPRGAGKSSLYRQLSASLEPRAQAARINGALVSSAREVLYAMVQGFALGVGADAEPADMRDAIANHVRQQQRVQRSCICLIDDADLLDPRAMDQLVTLVKATPLRLVLFGEVRLVSAVERPLEQQAVTWHEIRLGGFDPDEVRAYLEWRFQQVGHSGALPFSAGEVKEIARLSEGLPGRIDQIANVVLVRLQTGGDSPGWRFPARHRALLVGLLVLVGLVYVLWQPESQPPDAVAVRTERIDVPVPETRARPSTPTTPASIAAPAPEPAPTATAVAAPSAEAEPEAAEPEAAEPEAVEPEAVEPATTAGADAVPMRASPAATVRDARWILGQPSDSYTLQLVSLSSADRVRTYLGEQADPGRFATYRLQRNGRVLHVVIYGTYADRAAAEAAARDLPASVGSVQPWIRPFADVQAAVRTALQS
jgi:DamX protein